VLAGEQHVVVAFRPVSFSGMVCTMCRIRRGYAEGKPSPYGPRRRRRALMISPSWKRRLCSLYILSVPYCVPPLCSSVGLVCGGGQILVMLHAKVEWSRQRALLVCAAKLPSELRPDNFACPAMGSSSSIWFNPIRYLCILYVRSRNL
jgi:hypothetical protein